MEELLKAIELRQKYNAMPLEQIVSEFEAYKTSPEYKLRNYHFSLEEFKEKIKDYFPHIQAMAQQNIHPGYNNALATCYSEGVGVEKDVKKAMEIWRVEAKKGNPFL